jgi:putative MFS transporter
VSLQANAVSFQTPKKPKKAAILIARLDRIPVWSLPYLSIGIIGLGFFFTFFDIGDINVSFIQTCTQIVPGCHPETASNYIALPVLLNLIGYVIGALALSPLADRFGRRDMIVVSMGITGLGSLYAAFAGDYTNFLLARILTGIGIGADLAFVNTYITEIAPNRERAKYISLIFIMCMLGMSVAVWLGLYLTTPPAPFPLGLPFALATPHFVIGWRIMYGIGAWFPLIGVLLRSFALPESPRWLVSQGRLSEAERVVSNMERQALIRIKELPAIASIPSIGMMTNRTSYRAIFGHRLYFKRTIILLVIWLLGYMAVYSIVIGLTVLLTALGYSASEAGLIVAIGVVGYLASGLITYLFAERLERKYWILISAIVVLVGSILIAMSGNNFGMTVLGCILLGLGANLWIPIIYTWSAENYPTRARTTGFALVDGIGHIGGGIGMNYVVVLIFKIGPFGTFMMMGCFLLIAAWLAQFGPNTRDKRLDEVSP